MAEGTVDELVLYFIGFDNATNHWLQEFSNCRSVHAVEGQCDWYVAI